MSDMPPRRLLIVEDELTTLFALREYFAADQFVVDCTAGPTEARRMLNNVAYDVLLTDLHLTPQRRCEGLELLQVARQSTPGICAVLLTAFASTSVTRSAIELGADAVLAKPIALPELAGLIADISRRHASLNSGPILEPRT
jgi:DNA-binding response OmpR family regulator